MRISVKIFLGYLALMALLAAALFYQVSLVGQMHDLSRKLVEVNYEAGTASVDLRSEAVLIDDFTRRLFATSDPESYAPALEERLNVFEEQIEQVIGLPLSAAERAEFESLAERVALFRAAFSPFLAQPRRTIPESKRRRLQSQLEEIFVGIDRLIEVTRQSSEERIRQSEVFNQQVWMVAWVSGLAALGVALLLAFFIVRSIVKPIGKLEQATRRLASGDFEYRVPQKGGSELAGLAASFNTMAERIGELDQLKKDLLSHVSHDLKGPMASIQETTSLLLEEIPGPLQSSQRRLLELNLECSRRLSHMINTLLDVSRLEAGAMEYDFKPQVLGEILATLVREVAPASEEKGTPIELILPDQPVRATCDSTRIMQVVRNLLDNALHFSPVGSPVRVELTTVEEPEPEVPDDVRRELDWWGTPGFALVSVADKGPGVPEEHKKKIFDKFHQVEKTGSASGQGVGLGLAICLAIVRAHGGSLWVEDQPSGGSRFCFLIPTEAPRQAVQAPVFSTVE